jgi:hypothetical protein
MRLIYYQLWNHAAEGLDPEDAEELWKVLIRFVKYQQGRPSYPKFNWGMLASWLKSHKEIVTGV